MSSLELCLAGFALGCVLLGGLSICWAKMEHAGAVRWGRRLFVLALSGLGAVGLAAAFARAEGLAPLGLVGGFLVVAMLWESPASFRPAHVTDEN